MVVTGIALWFIGKMSKVAVGMTLLVLFVIFPMKAATVLLILIALNSLL